MIKKLSDLQREIGVLPDGVWGPKSATALREKLKDGVVIQITKNISLNELLASQTASRHGIDNVPDGKVLQNLIDSSNHLWQHIRDHLGKPIRISSGYRCEKLNSKVGGAKNSAHKYGYAIDFTCPDYGNTRKIVSVLGDFLRETQLPFDQLILEYPQSPNSWVHLGYKTSDGRQRKSSFTIK